ETFGIQRSLSMKGCPYDNAVAEAMFKVVKTEFTYGACFNSLDQLELELNDYVNWFNNIRIHGTDRKSTRLNSSHVSISYAVFCLKKKNYKSKSINNIY